MVELSSKNGMWDNLRAQRGHRGLPYGRVDGPIFNEKEAASKQCRPM
jgi:hypothetical protein